MSKEKVLDSIAKLYADRGNDQYGGEAVTQLEHGLQAAWEAEKSGATVELIAAALLHDVGHLLHAHGEDCAERGLDDRHEELGYRYLARHFGPAVAEPVRLHVPAKRYLCAMEPTYHAGLSGPSQLSLKLQGGPMNEREMREFEKLPYFESAVKLRRWDDLAKVPALATPGIGHFLQYVSKSLNTAR